MTNLEYALKNALRGVVTLRMEPLAIAWEFRPKEVGGHHGGQIREERRLFLRDDGSDNARKFGSYSGEGLGTGAKIKGTRCTDEVSTYMIQHLFGWQIWSMG